MMRNRSRAARYRYGVQGNYVIVLDVGGGQHASVTADAEGVLSDLAGVLNLSERRILLRDTSGRWNQLLHDGGRFLGFVPIGVMTAADAIRLTDERTARRFNWEPGDGTFSQGGVE